MSILDPFSVLLLDMNGVFMFGEDRFGLEQDFHSTYRDLGGTRLGASEVNQAIRSCYEGMAREYESPRHFDDFPTVKEGLRRYAGTDDADLDDLEATFALHERGSVPPAHADFIRELSRTHQLGLVSNIWAPKQPWLEELDRAGILDAFRVLVFSSDSRSIKPSPVLFRTALQAFPAGSAVLFVGDSLRCDIVPAKELGLSTAWITPETPLESADHVVPDLLSLGRF